MEPHEEIPSESPSTPTPEKSYLIPGSIVLAGVIIAFAVLYSGGAGTGGVLPPPPPSVPSVLENLGDDDPVLGNPDAPVTVVQFADFQCPYCRKFFLEAERQIIDTYVSSGQVKIVYRDFPLSFHPAAQKAAEGGECADDQGKFWQYHDKIYTEQDKMTIRPDKLDTISFGVADIKRWAGEIGIDQAQFDQCLDSGKYASEVANDLEQGQIAGVRGTPGTFVGTRLIEGAVQFAQFQSAIEAELKK